MTSIVLYFNSFILIFYIIPNINSSAAPGRFYLSIFKPMIPNTSVLYPLYIKMNKIGLYNKLLGLLLVYTGLGLPEFCNSCFTGMSLSFPC